MPEKITAIKAVKGNFSVATNKNKNFQAKTLIIASGSRRKELGVPGEKKFKGKGMAYCSTCDAPVFKNKIVAVIGGGNSALEAVIDLIPYAKKIYLLSRSGLRADPLLQEKIKKSPKITVVNNAEVKEILGGGFVSGLKYLDKKTNKVKKLAVEGVFVEIGTVPNSEIFKNFVKMNTDGEIIVDRKTMATGYPGIFAAGDVTDEIYKQNNISAGDGIIAALSAYNYLQSLR
jgi:alkyl hydroperoxide reductase subunit AhpF